MQETLLLLLSFLIEAIIIWQYASNIFIPEHSTRARVLLLSILYFMLFLFSLCQYAGLNIILFFAANTFFLYTQFKIKISFVLFHSAILTAIMGITELAAFGFILKFFPHFLSMEDLGLIFYGIFSKSLFFTATYILAHLFKPKTDAQKSYDRSEFFLTLIPIFSIFVMFTFFSIGETTAFNTPTSIMVTLSAFFLLLTNMLVFGINQYNQKKSREFTEIQLLLQKESNSAEYYAMLLSQNENQSILIHDLKTHLQSIKLLNEKGEADKINEYILNLMETSDLKETSRICDHAMLNAILNRYQQQCNEKNIAFHIDIRSNTTQYLCQNDLTSLFCNLLDNAVEAAEHIPNSFIELTVERKENSPFIIIVVINSCLSAPKYDQSGLPVTHKSDKGRHGFGIKSIRKAAKKYQGDLQMYYDNDSATFHTIVTLKQ